ncbi:hypothetical protein CLAFUW4_09443 [Fulvia fulva]|uniref:ATPase domain-containing protein n=1 Tax=Passalora fulva TaxID=5499 RepID=A0A9Q8PGX8_PASFU|nr:uncharacterized protein CLAFUR5_09540 [Fulvia fulva]KAK4613313.1 hypothetical protein CLAFUR4_09449 [Fulvia fulva]KAK4614792.1 hypothetical protein CLAFUR0_09440 [Fulvia fulva]UJO22258.1 hypothetical protein CLAFUR5_09540 [Fulvia fulva]WPV20307.1 hypothetical protein CLAFUW4_09443 [Fulvia fulva]WPV35691.1 hypothetical protein CLAFUW7_09444 [Fulvia fulva]
MASLIRHTRPSTPLLTKHTNLHFSAKHARSLMGLGEIAGVVANPAETLRQLNESKEMLRKAKEDHELTQEAKKIPRKHTFSKLPGFHGRKNEQALFRRILSNDPRLSVIFGATSVGKTALLREVLATDDFYVIKFDLRISGFADLRTLYLTLCEQFERFFEEMHDEEMDKSKLTFKHLVLELNEKESTEKGYTVTVADLASLMESLQSCLLKYWEYDPESQKEEKQTEDSHLDQPAERRADTKAEQKQGEASKDKPAFRKKPIVFLLDEAHKLPALVDDLLSLKAFLDCLLVLSKQDRLCHVILCTSDSFFQHFLRQMNIGHHAQLMTIGDCTKEETLLYFLDQMLSSVPQDLAGKLAFDPIYDAFGGKLSHINDYIASWANSGGTLTPETSAIFIQAYTLLQFHLTRADFQTFSPLSTATDGTSTEDDGQKFSPDNLLYVMKKMVKEPYSLPYFKLCRDIGTAQVDSMIKTRILELRWIRSVTDEHEGSPEHVWSKDGVERPVVMPMTKIIRKAMEVILKEEGETE